MTDANPDTRSSDLESMMPYWTKARAILNGLDAVLAHKDVFLPKLPEESDDRYKSRLSCASFTNVFLDTVENLAARAFAKQVVAKEDTTDSQLDELLDNIDARGNNVHVVTAASFHDAIAMAVDFIFVDHSANVPENATVADLKRLGARPYWARYRAENVLAAELAMVKGEAQFVYVKFLEVTTRREGFKEITETRVRVIEREDETPADQAPEADRVYGKPKVTVWKKAETATGGKETWEQEGETRTLGLDYIPLVALVLGRQEGLSWNIRPPMKAALELQAKLIRQETRLEYASEETAYPMLTGNGVSPPLDAKGEPQAISTGPGIVLYAPYTGDGSTPSWDTLEPSATSLKFLADQVETTKQDARELGRQPLTARSGNLTRITTAFAASKGNSAVQAWAIIAKDAYELALRYTADWLESDMHAELVMAQDLDTAMREDDGFGHVLALRTNGDLSSAATLREAVRRDILDREFDLEANAEELLGEIEDDDPLDDDARDDPPDDDQQEDERGDPGGVSG